jgi:ABC-type multidrug transport system permease subunit
MAFKDFYAAYVIVAPMLLLLILRFFLPSVESSEITVAVVTQGPNAVEQSVLDELEQYASVVSYDSVDAVKERLRGTGSAEGLYWDPEEGQYVSLLEENIDGNTLFSTGARAVRQATMQERYPDAPSSIEFTAGVPPEFQNRSANSPIATMGGAIFIAAMTIMMGFIIGVSIVRDKELGTDRAIRVSPASRVDYYLGKSVFPVLVFLFYAAVSVFVLGVSRANLLQLYTIVGASVAVVLLFGLLVGALARNETEALGLVKSVGTVLLLGVLGGTILPDAWHWVVWWVPLYWIFDAAEQVFTLTAEWTGVLWRSGIVIGISLVAYLLLSRRIARGLS